ncbi:MAG TPA: hypothetical protein VGI58_16640 [Streptosporangiaceae bacterium]|jgi:hypothetical protein
MASAARDRGKALVTAGTTACSDALRGRAKKIVFAGTAVAVIGGAGAGSAVALTSSPAPHIASLQATSPGHGLAAAARGHGGNSQDPRAAAGRHGTDLTAAQSDATKGQAAKPGHARHGKAAKPGGAHSGPATWSQVMDELNAQTNPAAAAHHQLPQADMLSPTGVSGPQLQMDLSPTQVANAKTIVQQAISKKMGVRSAVVAVATAMQESMLQNIGYGTSDSLGLFQQRPSCGWGSAEQIMNPAYSADAFLAALQHYQASNPGWASEPLWQVAQGVQASANPTAYARWEVQATGLVQQIAMQVVHL